MKKNLIITFILLAVISLFFISCGAAVPTKELETAKIEIKRAEMSDAMNLDRENFVESKTELEVAEKLVNEKKNEEAKVKALNSIVKARVSLINSKEKILAARIDKNNELINECNKYHAKKIGKTDFEKGESLNKDASLKQQKIKTDKSQLNIETLKTGDSVAKLEVWLKDSDDAIKIANESSTFLEKALISSKERLQKLEENLSEGNNIYNQLQKDNIMASNFKDKLESIKNRLNEANENYNKFKTTEKTEEALEYLAKAEALALEARNEVSTLSKEGKTQLQTLYKQKAQDALKEARDRANEAQRIYQNRQQPAGSTRNPWIPRTYNNLRTKANEYFVEVSEDGSSNSSQQSTQSTNAETQNETNQNQNQQQSTQGENQNQSSQQQESQTQQQHSAQENTREQTQNQNQNTERQGEGQTPQQSQQTQQSNEDIERQLNQQGQSEQTMSIDELYKKMQEKLQSADEKYKNNDYVGAWEDAEEAKKIASKIKEMTSTQTTTQSSYQIKNFEIWKYYVVKYRRINTDCLWRIALAFYKDATLWPVIWYANKLKIADPDLILPGQKLAIPKINNKK